jgi:hypothetical protein
VLPVTAHPAFHKAAHYLGLTVVTTPVDADFRALVDPLADAITDRTVLVVASAPSYPTGTVDPVPAIAAAAAERGVRCHVDACIGGWVLPFLPDPPPFDLSVPGAGSLSVDLHKYGYTPKGASVLLFAEPELRRHAWYAYAGWPGYPVINPTVQSAKSAGPLAAAWAVLRHVSLDGYRSLALAARDALLRLAAGVSAVDGLRVLGVPDSTLLAVAGSPGVDVFVVADEPARQRLLRAGPAVARGRAGQPALLRARDLAVHSGRTTGRAPGGGGRGPRGRHQRRSLRRWPESICPLWTKRASAACWPRPASPRWPRSTPHSTACPGRPASGRSCCSCRPCSRRPRSAPIRPWSRGSGGPSARGCAGG